MKDYIKVIGAGLAGSEAAWQIANRGVKVKLYEMKPFKYSPAHHLDTFAELMCTNSMRSNQLENAVGLLKEEMRRLNSIIIHTADETRVPAGGALAVDREGFSQRVTEKLREHPQIEIVHEEVERLEEDVMTVVATGPLTSEGLAEAIRQVLGNREYLYVHDASAPIVNLESINMEIAFRAARYGRGDDDYINCPMTKEQYEAFYQELVSSEVVALKDFEKEIVFEGCMPIETMAKRGVDTMRFGPLKPVGIEDPRTGKEPYAVVQLRQDNKEGSLFNLVGFQTHLKFPEQKRVFRMIPGLENAEFERLGVMHRNTFIQSPSLLDETYGLKSSPNLYFAGQMTGVEGYVESAASGLVAGMNAALSFLGKEKLIFPKTTAIGSLAWYISDESIRDFQPMNVNFGIMEKLDLRIRDKRQKNFEIAQKALAVIDSML